MHLSVLSLAAQVALVVQMLPVADAFWRLPCRGRLGVARIDPLMEPGKVAGHAHVIHGGNSMYLPKSILCYFLVYCLLIKLERLQSLRHERRVAEI